MSPMSTGAGQKFGGLRLSIDLCSNSLFHTILCWLTVFESKCPQSAKKCITFHSEMDCMAACLRAEWTYDDIDGCYGITFNTSGTCSIARIGDDVNTEPCPELMVSYYEIYFLEML